MEIGKEVVARDTRRLDREVKHSQEKIFKERHQKGVGDKRRGIGRRKMAEPANLGGANGEIREEQKESIESFDLGPGNKEHKRMEVKGGDASKEVTDRCQNRNKKETRKGTVGKHNK